MRCPVCNRQYPLSEIEIHADECLSRKQTAFACGTSEDSICMKLDEQENDSDYAVSDDGCSTTNTPAAIKVEIVRALEIAKNSKSEAQTITIPVRRNFAFRDFHNFFMKPWNWKKRNRSYNIQFIGEAGVDTGGVSRDFYTESMMEVKQQFFAENEDGSGYEPVCGTVSVADGTARTIGHLIAASLCHGGPGPGIFVPWLYCYLSGGIDKVRQNLPLQLDKKCEYGSVYNELRAATADKEVVEIFATHQACVILENIGYRGDPTKATLKNRDNVLQSIFIKSKIEPCLPVLVGIAEGLECYKIRDIVKSHVELLQPVFCPSSLFTWDHNNFLQILKPSFAEDGSNKKMKEMTTYKAFLDFTDCCWNDDLFPLEFQKLMKFLTGSSTLPPLGLPNDLSISFLHGCRLSPGGTKCRCLPTVSTCAISVVLPVHIETQEEMLNVFQCAITCEIGFGQV
ncbi:ubiquitin-protein ligase E3C-like [Ciona intestinalis]